MNIIAKRRRLRANPAVLIAEAFGDGWREGCRRAYERITMEGRMTASGRPRTFAGVRDWLWPGVSGLDPGSRFWIDPMRDVLVVELCGERFEITRAQLEDETWAKGYGDWLAGVRRQHGSAAQPDAADRSGGG